MSLDDAVEERGTAAVLARELKELHGFEVFEVARPADGSALVAVVPDGKTVQDMKPILDNYLAKPDRRIGTAKLTAAVSFIAHVMRFKGPASAVFANPDRTRPSFTAVFDYHAAGPDVRMADYGKHRATYEPALSDPWKEWMAKNGVAMAQGDFAEFVEKHITDVIVPNFDDPNLKTFADLVQGRFATPSDLLQLSRGLAINVETSVKNAIQLGTGEISVVYEEVHRDGAGQPISIANLFQICIPVFYAGENYRIAARLRYRNHGGKLHWSYQLVRPDLVFDDAFNGIAEKVRTETSAPVFLGSPEA